MASPTVAPAVKLTRLWFRFLSSVAPTVAERMAANLFLTPRRRPDAGRIAAPQGAQRLTAIVADKKINGWSWGEGPVVFLVHGWSGRALDMAELASEFAAAGYRAVAFDMPAHGETAGRRTSLGEWLNIIPLLARECGEPIHIVVGHSLGAAAVTLALEAGVDARGAVLIAPPVGPIYFTTRLQRFIGLPAARTRGMEAHLVKLVGREMSFFDSARAAAHLEVPALILHDPADREVPWAHAKKISEAWRDSELIEAPGKGHYRILKSPEIAQAVIEFANRLHSVPA